MLFKVFHLKVFIINFQIVRIAETRIKSFALAWHSLLSKSKTPTICFYCASFIPIHFLFIPFFTRVSLFLQKHSVQQYVKIIDTRGWWMLGCWKWSWESARNVSEISHSLLSFSPVGTFFCSTLTNFCVSNWKASNKFQVEMR